MLMLTRYPHQRVFINCPNGDIIEIFIKEVQSRQRIRFGFDAPKEYKICRGEHCDESGRHIPYQSENDADSGECEGDESESIR